MIGVVARTLLLPLALLLLSPVGRPSTTCSAFPSPSSVVVASGSRRRRVATAATKTELSSVPTPFDTFASGLASMFRLPRGVSVSPDDGISMSGPAAAFLPVLRRMYDVENDRHCRFVRERITELDLVVERVMPCARNSRNRAGLEAEATTTTTTTTTALLPTLIVEANGKEVALSGAENVLRFLDENFSVGAVDDGDDEEEEEDATTTTVRSIARALSELASYLPSVLRVGRGSTVCAAASSNRSTLLPLVLYSYEGNQFCRLVREALTELDLTYELRSCGKGSSRRGELSELTGGSTACPYLIDPNTGIAMAESKDIVEYLYSKYALWTPPSEFLRWASDFVIAPVLGPVFGYLAPLQAKWSYNGEGNEYEYASAVAEAKAEIYDEISSRPVVIYTYEYSPFCSEAVALLRRIGIDHVEISLGKGWIPGLLTRPEKRVALLEITRPITRCPSVFIGGKSIGGCIPAEARALMLSWNRGDLLTRDQRARADVRELHHECIFIREEGENVLVKKWTKNFVDING
ncbi:hypothetical protein ACHAW5_003769 [Stephanodiscus triporus]|uniref:GST N-terminal domain-containing protein n=1 Tax=Stephanodiscus triporus TaxID=2934178 RepID=A0ABD3NI71_9STRA